MRLAILLILLAVPAAADERKAFYGTWGTAEQCIRKPVKPGGTVLAAPFEISANWLKQGEIACRLTWFPVEPRDGGAFSGARAQCGEDAVRDYRVRMKLTGDTLTLHWDFTLTNGPLARCPGR